MRSLVLPLILALSFFEVSCASKDSKKTASKNTPVKTTKPMKKVATKNAPVAATDTKSDSTSVSCKLETFTRELSLVKPAAGGCEVIYTKDGDTKTIANGNNVSGYCSEVYNRVKGKLESAGFKCE